MKETDERYTPEYVLDVVRAFANGPISLDPCTTPDNRTRALRFFTKEDDGLGRDWGVKIDDVVWVNPPYSRGQLRVWVGACLKAYPAHVIALLPCDLGSVAGQAVAGTASRICFPKGRIRFISPTDDIKTGAKQPSMLAYWGSAPNAFVLHFSRLGVVR